MKNIIIINRLVNQRYLRTKAMSISRQTKSKKPLLIMIRPLD